MTPPTENGHAPRSIESRESCQSVKPYCVTTTLIAVGISSASPGRAFMSASIESIMSKRASCVIQCVGEWDASWRGKSGPCGCTRSVFPSWTICVHVPPLMFAASVTVTKARRHGLIRPSWSTHARLLEPCAQLSRPGSICDPVRFRSDRTGR